MLSPVLLPLYVNPNPCALLSNGINPNAEFIVEGHTDSIGSESFNQTLSEERAASIVAFLVSNGIDTARLTAVGFGETSPISEDSTKEGMAQNRRVEIKLAN